MFSFMYLFLYNRLQNKMYFFLWIVVKNLKSDWFKL